MEWLISSVFLLFICTFPCPIIYAVFSPSLDGVFDSRRSTAGTAFIRLGEVGLDGGEVAISSKLANALVHEISMFLILSSCFTSQMLT